MRRNIMFLFLLFVGTGQSLLAQNLVGTWQKGSEIVGAGLGESYQFSENGKFEFIVSQYIYLSTIISFSGTYKVDNNQIYFVIKSRKERVVYRITQGSPYWQDNWILNGDEEGQKVEIKQDPVTYCFDFELIKKDKQYIIRIGNTMYYKVRKEDL